MVSQMENEIETKILQWFAGTKGFQRTAVPSRGSVTSDHIMFVEFFGV